MRRSNSASSLLETGRRRKSFTPARMAWMRIVLSGHVGPETVRPENGRHGGLGRDDRRFLRKSLQGPDIGAHFHQRDLRTAAAGRLDRLADVAA